MAHKKEGLLCQENELSEQDCPVATKDADHNGDDDDEGMLSSTNASEGSPGSRAKESEDSERAGSSPTHKLARRRLIAARGPLLGIHGDYIE